MNMSEPRSGVEARPGGREEVVVAGRDEGITDARIPIKNAICVIRLVFIPNPLLRIYTATPEAGLILGV
jgi:hypothetical protein